MPSPGAKSEAAHPAHSAHLCPLCPRVPPLAAHLAHRAHPPVGGVPCAMCPLRGDVPRCACVPANQRPRIRPGTHTRASFGRMAAQGLSLPSHLGFFALFLCAWQRCREWAVLGYRHDLGINGGLLGAAGIGNIAAAQFALNAQRQPRALAGLCRTTELRIEYGEVALREIFCLMLSWFWTLFQFVKKSNVRAKVWMRVVRLLPFALPLVIAGDSYSVPDNSRPGWRV